MIYKEFFGLLFLAFVGWVLLAGSGGERINRFCEPVGWAGNVVVSVSALATGPEGQAKVQKVFNHTEYGCRYITWRLFYQKSYDQWKATQSGTSVPGVPAASKPSVKASVPMHASSGPAPVKPSPVGAKP